jgi:hypothetical protein
MCLTIVPNNSCFKPLSHLFEQKKNVELDDIRRGTHERSDANRCSRGGASGLSSLRSTKATPWVAFLKQTSREDKDKEAFASGFLAKKTTERVLLPLC